VRSENDDELVAWHNQRSHDILETIVESDFGKRVQKLIIYAACSGMTGNHAEVLASQIGVLIFS
jgi:hypothetical protein